MTSINTSIEAPDIDVTAIQRQQGVLTDQTLEQFIPPRSSGVSADAAFTFGTRASRPASGLAGDRYFATDRNALYAYSGTAWAVVVGLFAGTDATRSGWTIDSTDNNSFFYTTDTGKLWEVVSGAWVDRFTTVTLTTALKIGANQVISARKAAVADVASVDATDLATVITLANETKAQLNALLNRVRASTGHGLIA
jgi:hypothetical protein